MKHSVRCERAKGPVCKCRCGGENHGIDSKVYITPPGALPVTTPKISPPIKTTPKISPPIKTTPIEGRYLCIPMGGKVAEIINQFLGKKFICTCGAEVRIRQFIGYSDIFGYPDQDGTRWQIYTRCPNSNCKLDRPIWEISIKYSAVRIPGSERIRFTLESYLEAFEERWPDSLEMPGFELQEEEECFLLVDRDCHINQGIKSETTVCGGILGALEHCMEWVTGYNRGIEKITQSMMGRPVDTFRIEKAVTV